MTENKSDTQQAEAFDYESQGENDDLYSAIMTNQKVKPPHKKPGPKPKPKPAPVNEAPTSIFVPGTEMPAVPSTFNLPPVKESDFQQLYMIEGRVRRDAIGEDSVFSDQKRLVWAKSFEEAVRKYNSYFAGLSNFNERYSVVMAGGSEAIS